MDYEQDIEPPPPYEEYCSVVQQPVQLEFQAWVSSAQQPREVLAGYPAVYYNYHPQQQPMTHTSAVTLPLAVPHDYVALTLFATVCCCLPFGLVGIVFASQVDPAWARGNYATANIYSKLAKGWGIAAIITGCCIYAFLIILVIVWST